MHLATPHKLEEGKPIMKKNVSITPVDPCEFCEEQEFACSDCGGCEDCCYCTASAYDANTEIEWAYGE